MSSRPPRDVTRLAPDSSSRAVTRTSTMSESTACERLLRAFMQRAYRRAPQEADVQLFLDLIKQRMGAGLGFAGSVLAGYTAVLSSPQFLFVDEQPGRLDEIALATRLALFLWNSEPDEALRARPIVGLPLLAGFKPEAGRPGHWAGGTIYDPESGKTYNGTITLQPDGGLSVRGYVGMPMFGRTVVWTRIP